ncbi:Phosphoglycolate phosphatase [Bremerella volcania]|uniref:phosphoglycolate phosphatase n=1 Tax=Bremerella volcania TaxID=2527984 RepID=A0A518C381_9BACT|nr:HAD hydrolase-like protein [Bremerella volcania]QDU73686.1 Phosphoglycolate phosphatase [Bremerella volcania]
MNTTIRTIVFDFDGVLVASNAIKRDAYFRIFEDAEISSGQIDLCIRQNYDGNRYDVIGAVVDNLLNPSLLPSEFDRSACIEQYATLYNEHCESAVAECDEVAGTSEILDQLYGKIPLYINSATLEEPLQRIVRQRGWHQRFQGVFGSPTSKVANLEKIRQAENCLPEEIAFVGDGQRDGDAARAFGCLFVGVRNDHTDFVAPIPYEIVRFTELIEVLENIASNIKAA